MCVYHVLFFVVQCLIVTFVLIVVVFLLVGMVLLQLMLCLLMSTSVFGPDLLVLRKIWFC